MRGLLCGISVCLISCTPSRIPCLPQQKPELKLGDPQPLKLDPVKFSITGNESPDVFFSLTDRDYKNLSLNMEKIKLFIIEQKKIIELYRNYYEGEDKDAER